MPEEKLGKSFASLAAMPFHIGALGSSRTYQWRVEALTR